VISFIDRLSLVLIITELRNFMNYQILSLKHRLYLSGLITLILLPLPAWGHKVKTDAQVGATIHFEPADRPKSLEPTKVWFALTKKGGTAIPLKDCQCQLQIKQLPGNQKIATPQLQAINAEKYQDIPSATVIFPQPGAYSLELTGQSVKPGDFQPFKLEFDAIVSVGTALATPPVVFPEKTVEEKKTNDLSAKMAAQLRLSYRIHSITVSILPMYRESNELDYYLSCLTL
jgi:hypothetical protein